jgi:ABC-type glycerol-3-phosphate transport system substrate-binding protein
MKKVRRIILGAIVPTTLVALALAGCSGTSGDAGSGVDPKAKVTISLSNQPPETQPADLANYKKVIADFEKKYPNVTVKGREIGWTAQTFQAQLAGKQLPTIMALPLTEPQGLIARKQVADITSELKQVGLLDKLNPTALKSATDKAGHFYGVPLDAYALGLLYNRELFTKAGLDPDKPPTTWDAVRKDAKIIADKTGAAGYGQMTTGGQGGWTLTAMSYSAGGTIENAAGTAVTMTDAPKATQRQLQLLHDMRWVDDSMGSNFNYDQNALLQDFAAGKIGMMIGAPVSYQFATQLFGMDGSQIGLGSMPQGAKAGGTLSGGGVLMVMPNATPAQRLAAAEFLDFKLSTYTDKTTAVAFAKSQAAAKLPVGLPLTWLKPNDQKQYLEWVKPYINVPTQNFSTYNATLNSITQTSEPAKNAQEVYAALDPVVQAVLTQKDANVPSLLANAKTTIQGLLSR